MGGLFLTSFLMGLIIIAVLIQRKFKSHKFSSKAYYFLWMIIALRLILPFDISLKAPIYNFSNPVEKYSAIENNTNINGNIVDIDENTLKPNENINPEIDNNKPLAQNISVNIFDILNRNLFNIWLVGGALYLAYHLIVYYIFKSKLNSSLSLVDEKIEEKFSFLKLEMDISSKIDIRESTMIDSPMIVGLIKPILVLPKNIEIENIEYIFTHELIHLRRRDIIYKAFIFFATVIHWFNPVVHIMSKVAGQDLELSCDEEVIKNMDRDEKIIYSNVLVNAISISKSPIYTSNFSGGVDMVKKRLDKILDSINKRSSKPLIAILILSILGTSFLIGCDNNMGKSENLGDKLYSYRTDNVLNDLNVSNIISSLDFQKEHDAKSMGSSTNEYSTILGIRFIEDEEIDFKDEKFFIQSAILFSLIEDIDVIEYMRVVEPDVPQTEIVSRFTIDDMTVSVLGMKTEELGSSKEKFKELVDYYKAYKEERDNIEIPKSLDKGKLKATEYNEVDKLKGLKMTAKKGTLTNTSVTLLLENKSEMEILYGTYFILEKEKDGSWYEMPVTKNVAYEDIGYKLDIGDKDEIVTEWGWVYGQADPGKYRIIKIIPDMTTENGDEYYLAAEFEIK